MNRFDGWQYYALMVFAIVAGQIARLGYRVERGAKVGRMQIMIELTMLPAFGALGGSLAHERDWPVWMVLGSGIMAGWIGFGMFKLALDAIGVVIKQRYGGGDK